jgi:hypothetical protein
LYAGLEEIGVKCLKTGGDSLQHAGVCCKSLANQMLRKGSENMDVTGREIGTADRIVRNLPAVAP